MEYLDGATVKTWLRAHPLPAPEAAAPALSEAHVALATAIGRNIARLHDSSIVHGDLTTSNMLVLARGTPDAPVVVRTTPSLCPSRDLCLLGCGSARLTRSAHSRRPTPGHDRLWAELHLDHGRGHGRGPVRPRAGAAEHTSTLGAAGRPRAPLAIFGRRAPSLTRPRVGDGWAWQFTVLLQAYLQSATVSPSGSAVLHRLDDGTSSHPPLLPLYPRLTRILHREVWASTVRRRGRKRSMVG